MNNMRGHLSLHFPIHIDTISIHLSILNLLNFLNELRKMNIMQGHLSFHFPIHIDTISMHLSILNFKGSL